MNHLLSALRALWSLVPHCIYAGAFVVVGMITNWSLQQTRMYESMSEVAKAKYEAQRTSDMVALLKSTKPSMGCPVEEVRDPKKKGKAQKVC